VPEIKNKFPLFCKILEIINIDHNCRHKYLFLNGRPLARVCELQQQKQRQKNNAKPNWKRQRKKKLKLNTTLPSVISDWLAKWLWLTVSYMWLHPTQSAWQHLLLPRCTVKNLREFRHTFMAKFHFYIPTNNKKKILFKKENKKYVFQILTSFFIVPIPPYYTERSHIIYHTPLF